MYNVVEFEWKKVGSMPKHLSKTESREKSTRWICTSL